MDRLKVRNEYRRILDDAIDWLRDGYRREGIERIDVEAGSETSTASRDLREKGPGASQNVVEPEMSTPDFRIAKARETSEGKAAFTSRHGRKLGRVAEAIARCERCNLSLIRENTVPGVGAENPLLMIVTAAPVFGARENDGPLPPYESEYLDKWLKALNLRPGLDTFITPAVKCRTPGGRPPDPKELGECFQYLKRQFTELKPGAILALGAAACAALTGDISDFSSLVGKPWNWSEVPSLVLWTPAEVLENPTRLRKPVWEALQKLRDAWNALPRAGV